MSARKRFAAVTTIAALTLALLATAGCTKVITAPAGSAANTVTATGSGTAHAAPDSADMSFGVTRHAADAKTALADASTVAQSITDALTKGGVDKKDIQTQNVNVSPSYAVQNGKQVVAGFDASIAVSVKIRDLAKLGDLITAGNAAGADNINGPTLTLADPAPTRGQAIALAVADARKTADAMAKAAGKSVGGVLSISTSDVSPGPVPLFDSATAAGSARSVPIEPGQLDVTENVTVIFELK
jgi:uncharacterized protein YggE